MLLNTGSLSRLPGDATSFGRTCALASLRPALPPERICSMIVLIAVLSSGCSPPLLKPREAPLLRRNGGPLGPPRPLPSQLLLSRALSRILRAAACAAGTRVNGSKLRPSLVSMRQQCHLTGTVT